MWRVLRRARFGPANINIENPGYCRTDGLSGPAQAKSSDIEPSCLYVWRVGSTGFAPLELANVQDIVFPPTHVGARKINGMSMTDLESVITSLGSPWSAEFCKIGARRAVLQVLAHLGKQANTPQLCGTVNGNATP